jgi:hypothetical protein
MVMGQHMRTMTRLLIVAMLMTLASLAAAGQSTTVTATISDPAGTVWASGSYTITFVGSSSGAPFIAPSGQSFTTSFAGTLNSSGQFTQALTDVAFIHPSNSTWKFCVAPATVPSQSFCTTVPVTGASQSVSAQINAAIQSPTFTGSQLVRAYNDGEVQGVNGNQYYNVTSNVFRCFVGGAWGNCAGSGGGIGGSGSSGLLPLWTGSVSLGNSLADYGVTTAGQFTLAAPLNYPNGNIGSFGFAPGGCIDPRNVRFGATGDGVTDDTAALQAAWNYSQANGDLCIYLATPPVCYKVSAPLLIGGNIGNAEIAGDGGAFGKGASDICYTPDISDTSAVFDAVLHGSLVIHGIAVSPLNGTTSAGSCIYSAPYTSGGAILISIYDDYFDCGSGTGSNAIAIIAQDIVDIKSSTINSDGNGVVMGTGNTPNTTTSHYSIGAGYGVTHLGVYNNYILSTLAPIELTGSCGDIVVSNAGGVGYAAEINGGDPTHGIVDLSYPGNTCPPQLNLYDANLENQTNPHAAVPATVYLGTGSGSVLGGTWTGRLGGGNVLAAGGGGFVNVNVNAITPPTLLGDTTTFVNGSIFSNAATALSPTAGGSPGFSGVISGSTISGSWNSLTVAKQPTSPYNDSFRICSNLYYASDFCWSNSGSFAGNSLNILGGINFGTGANIHSGTGILNITPTQLSWNQSFNMNGFVSGLLSNLATWSNNFSGGTWTNSGFVITAGQPGPPGETATILSCASSCSLTDTYSATPLTASTLYQDCIYGSLTSGTNSFYMASGNSGSVGGGILTTSGWSQTCVTVNSGSSNLTQTLQLIVPNGPTVITLYGASVTLASAPAAGYQYTGATPQPVSAPGFSPAIAINGQAMTPSAVTVNSGTNIVYTCSGGTTYNGALVFGAAGQALCTGAGGTATATSLTID